MGTLIDGSQLLSTNQKSKKVIGDFKLCVKMAQFDAKKYAEVGKAAGGDKKGKKEKKKQEPAEPAEEEPKPIKQKDPFEGYPKGNFDMEDFKRFYSNNDEDKSIPYFWEKFDKENYSIWRCDYKYADELTMVFMSCNLIGGMFQRLDSERTRFHLYASLVKTTIQLFPEF